MERLGEQNTTRDFMKSHYNDEKLDKSTELNARMTIKETPKDEYESTLHNLGGKA